MMLGEAIALLKRDGGKIYRQTMPGCKGSDILPEALDRIGFFASEIIATDWKHEPPVPKPSSNEPREPGYYVYRDWESLEPEIVKVEECERYGIAYKVLVAHTCEADQWDVSTAHGEWSDKLDLKALLAVKWTANLCRSPH